jgi:hypothetical protein
VSTDTGLGVDEGSALGDTTAELPSEQAVGRHEAPAEPGGGPSDETGRSPSAGESAEQSGAHAGAHAGGHSGHELSHLLPGPSGVDIAVEVLEERGEHS